MGLRFKRLIAFVIDWNIAFFPAVFIVGIFAVVMSQQSEVSPWIVLVMMLIILAAFLAVVLRDVIFKGRSLGKRIFGLRVYDKGDLKQASVGQCFLRNIFLFLYVIDGFVLLVSGQTIGDCVAGTLVTTEKSIEAQNQEEKPNLTEISKKNKKTIVSIIIIPIVILVAFIGIILLTLNGLKNTEEYQVAYSYFIESQAFEALGATEADVRFNGYKVVRYSDNEHHGSVKIAQMQFTVKFKTFEVVCYEENGVWMVCEACTLFK